MIWIHYLISSKASAIDVAKVYIKEVEKIQKEINIVRSDYEKNLEEQDFLLAIKRPFI